jgi:hypothetical protein
MPPQARQHVEKGSKHHSSLKENGIALMIPLSSGSFCASGEFRNLMMLFLK